jgi:hypothetical protein
MTSAPSPAGNSSAPPAWTFAPCWRRPPRRGRTRPRPRWPTPPRNTPARHSWSQPWPDLASRMDPPPDHGETSYRGSGRLAGRARSYGADQGRGSPGRGRARKAHGAADRACRRATSDRRSGSPCYAVAGPSRSRATGNRCPAHTSGRSSPHARPPSPCYRLAWHAGSRPLPGPIPHRSGRWDSAACCGHTGFSTVHIGRLLPKAAVTKESQLAPT